MEELIRRSDAIKVVRHTVFESVDADTRQKLIEAIPAVEPNAGTFWKDATFGFEVAKEVFKPKQGAWIDKGADLDGTWYYQCSECSAEVENVEYPHCPYCLARMEGADDERL